MSKGPFVEYTYKNWQEVLSHSCYFADDMGFIFRGHACSDWSLNTTLDRHLSRISPKGIDLQSTYDFLLKEFVKSIRGRSNINKNTYANQDELWALGQHYGLATPLLDWTHSLYVALFFAFDDPTVPASGYRTVWALKASSDVKGVIDNYNKSKDESQKFKMVDPISDDNPRLITQTGLFTRQPLDFNLVDWVNEYLREKAPFLIKINVPNCERLKILKHLRLMNIHPATLFPEIDGAARYCNQTLELLSSKSQETFNNSRAELERVLEEVTNKQR